MPSLKVLAIETCLSAAPKGREAVPPRVKFGEEKMVRGAESKAQEGRSSSYSIKADINYKFNLLLTNYDPVRDLGPSRRPRKRNHSLPLFRKLACQLLPPILHFICPFPPCHAPTLGTRAVFRLHDLKSAIKARVHTINYKYFKCAI